MEQSILNTEIDKAVEAGFTEQFQFVFENLCCLVHAGLEYNPKDVIRRSCPCPVNQHTVYLVVTAEGIMGIAIIDWADFVFDD